MRKRNRKMAQKAIQANPQAILNVVSNVSPTPASEVARVMAGVRMAYERLRLGSGTQQDFIICESAVNIGLVRAEAIAPELVQAFKSAGEAMLECERIRRRHGSYGFTGPHIAAMNEAMDFYGQMIELSTPIQMHAAAKEADRRVQRGHVECA